MAQIIIACILLCVIYSGSGQSSEEERLENEPRPESPGCSAQIKDCDGQGRIREMEMNKKLPILSEDVCPELERSLRCIVNKLSECSAEHAKEITLMLNLTLRLCDSDDPLSQDYAASVDCLNNNLDIMRICINHLFLTYQLFVRDVLQLNYLDINRAISSCLGTMVLRSCILGQVANRCETRAINVADQLWQSMHYFLLEETCSDEIEQKMKEDIISYMTDQSMNVV